MANLQTEVQTKENGEKLSLINFIDHTIKEIKYGKIELTIHNEKVVEIQKIEKYRFL